MTTRYAYDPSTLWYTGTTEDDDYPYATADVPPVLDVDLVDGMERSTWARIAWATAVYRAPAASRVISRDAFRLSFTDAEKAAIYFAALDNPQAPMEERMAAALLRSWLDDLAAAPSVNLDSDRVVNGLAGLVQMGCLAADRQAVIRQLA